MNTDMVSQELEEFSFRVSCRNNNCTAKQPYVNKGDKDHSIVRVALSHTSKWQFPMLDVFGPCFLGHTTLLKVGVNHHT